MNVEFKFENGWKVKDKVSGMEGIVSSAALCLNGCIRYTVQPAVKKGETTMPDSWWVDEEQIEFVNKGVSKVIKSKPTGPPPERATRM